METILITGATGFLGSRVLEVLLKEGHGVIALVRSLPKKDMGGKLTFLKGDITKSNLGVNGQDWERLKDVNYIIHCAAIAHFQSRDINLLKTNVTGTKHVLSLARKLPKLKAFIHISSKSVAGNFEGIFPEQTLPKIESFHNTYERSKYKAEQLIRRSDIPFIIIRPPTIVGDSKTGKADRFEGSAYRLISALKKRRLPFYPSKCDGYLYIMPVDKVVEFIVRVSFDSDYIKTTFNLTEQSPLNFKDFIIKASKLLGVPKPSFTLPVLAWKTLLRLASIAPFMNTSSLSLLNQKLKYENKAFLSASKKYGIRYPPLVDYLPVLIKFYNKNS